MSVFCQKPLLGIQFSISYFFFFCIQGSMSNQAITFWNISVVPLSKELTEYTRVKLLPPKWHFVTVNYDISTTTQHYIPLFEHKQFWFPKRGKNYISCPMYLFTRTMHQSWCFQGKLHKKIKTSPLLFQVISLDLPKSEKHGNAEKSNHELMSNTI